MRILESILNIIFAITDCWQRTRDPLLNEYRSHARKIIAFSIMSIFLLMLAAFISPSNEGLHGIAIISRYLSQWISILAMIFLCATVWSSIAFFLFLRENGYRE